MDQTKVAKSSTMWFFFICGLGLSCWAPLVPFAKERLHLSESDLGVLLLLLGGGAMLMMPLSGVLISKYGSRNMMLTGGLIIALSLPILALSTSIIIMGIALFLFGGGIGMLDVSMNTHGIAIQRQYPKSIFSMLHGLFSVGALVGALCLSLFIKWGLSPFFATIIFSLFIIVVSTTQFKKLFAKDVEDEKNNEYIESSDTNSHQSTNVWLNASVLLLGFFCFSFFLIEGAMLDWSAVFLVDIKNVDVELGGIGYAAFSVAMAVMRLLGDNIISKLNNKVVIMVGGAISIVGLYLIISTSLIPLIILGFILIGIGTANIIPVFFAAGGKLKNLKTSLALSAITTIGYSGQLAGPALIGFIAEIFSLTVAFSFLIFIVFLAISIYFITTLKRSWNIIK